jgi:hypothetical protein
MDPWDPDDLLDRSDHRPERAARAAQHAAASRAYAAGSRDGAREMRMKAAWLVEASGCSCAELAGTRYFARVHAGAESHLSLCPASLAEAIRRLPDGGE